jgi:NAD(P)-dependent dehydrogenase (short-subunit alcohol dehydrogenase family)
MRADLTGTAALITGASSGIGAATARVMAGAGARVALAGRDAGRLESLAGSLPGDPLILPVDLRDAEAATGLADRAADALGTLDAVVHSAGIYEPEPLEDASLDTFERQWAVNVRAPWLITRAALPHLADGAAIVFVSSTVARAGFAGCSAYSATKGAVAGMARALAVELAPRIRVNTIEPGFVATPMVTSQYAANGDLEPFLVSKTPVGFVGAAEDIAHGIAFACSSLSRYMTGSTLTVDGGWTAAA